MFIFHACFFLLCTIFRLRLWKLPGTTTITALSSVCVRFINADVASYSNVHARKIIQPTAYLFIFFCSMCKKNQRKLQNVWWTKQKKDKIKTEKSKRHEWMANTYCPTILNRIWAFAWNWIPCVRLSCCTNPCGKWLRRL